MLSKVPAHIESKQSPAQAFCSMSTNHHTDAVWYRTRMSAEASEPPDSASIQRPYTWRWLTLTYQCVLASARGCAPLTLSNQYRSPPCGWWNGSSCDVARWVSCMDLQPTPERPAPLPLEIGHVLREQDAQQESEMRCREKAALE